MPTLNPTFTVTNAGLAAAAVATPDGPYIQIDEFRLGSGFGYTPSVSDTALHGTQLYSAIPYSYTIPEPNTIDILCLVDTNIGPFDFGEIGLYLPGGVLFALAAFSSQQQKLVPIGGQVGTRYKIHALLRMAQAPAVIQVNVTNVAGLLEVPDWQTLTAPVLQLAGANAAIVHEPDPRGHHPLVVRKDDYDWSVFKYSRKDVGTISAATTTKFTTTAFDLKDYDPTTNRRYLVKLTSTSQIGQIRSIQSINLATNEATINGSWGTAPTAGTTIELWEANESGSGCAPWASGYEYNQLSSAYNAVWATPNGFVSPQDNKGWNQTALPTVTSKPTVDQWATLINAVISGAKITGTPYSNVSVTDFLSCDDNPLMYGLQTMKQYYDALYECMNGVIGNKNTSDAAFTETNSPAGGTRVRSGTTWVSASSVTHIITIDYADQNTLCASFNAGGYLGVFGVVATPQNGEEFAWQAFLSSIGTVKLYADETIITGSGGTNSALGMYDLTGSYQTIYTQTITGATGDITYTVEAKRNSTTQIQIQVSFNDSSTGPYSGATTAVLTSTVVAARPSSAVIANPILAYPTMTSSGTL